MLTASPRASKKKAARPVFAGDFDLTGQVAVITGACGQLGTQFCESLGGANATVIGADRNETASEKLNQRLGKKKIKSDFFQMDVTSPRSVDNALSLIMKKHKKIDILVSAAAIAVFSPFESRSYEEFQKVMQVNVGGVFLTCQKAAALMKKQKTGGRIINIASVYGIVSSDPGIYTDCSRMNSEVYSASKAAVIMLSKYLAVHLAPYHIRVNCISPGGVFNGQGSDFVTRYSRGTPMGRMADEKEMNAALLFLASRASSYVTGHNLVIDGGRTSW